MTTNHKIDQEEFFNKCDDLLNIITKAAEEGRFSQGHFVAVLVILIARFCANDLDPNGCLTGICDLIREDVERLVKMERPGV